jgi:hypothetical protein
MSKEEDVVYMRLEEQFAIEALSNKISNILSVINTGKKITRGIVQNILLLWDEERRDFSTPHAKEVVRFRKSFLIKVNNRAKMIKMPVFKMWEDAIEVVMGDIDNPFLGDIRDISKLSVFPEGIYVGELQDGKPHGKGAMVLREQWSFYKGMWKNGLYHGVGNLMLKRYKKAYKIDLGRDITQRMRNIYEGEWKNGEKHGNGKLIHIDNLDPYGDDDNNCYIYDGNWKEGTKHGMGKIIEYSHINPIDRVYEGEWEMDFYHGKGRFINCRGDIYTGDFRYGQQHGVGKIIYYVNDPYDADWYEGDWKDHAECGKGKKKFRNGDLYEGEYYNFDQVELKYATNHHGVFHNFWYEGKKTYANGDVYVGEFYNHLRWGKGEMSFKHDRSVYCGTWSNDKMHGKGTFTYSGGKVTDEKWRRGVRLDDDASIKSFDSELDMVSDSDESSDNSYTNESDKSIEKSEKCPSCKTLTVSLIKSFPNPNVMCVCCRDEFCPIYCTIPCGHFICEECKDTYYGDVIPDIEALTLDD